MISRVEQSVINFSRTVGNLLTKNVYPDLIQLFDLLNGFLKDNMVTSGKNSWNYDYDSM